MNDRQISGETREGGIDLIKLASSVWKIFRRRWYIFTAVMLLAGALGGYLGTKGFRPTYTSKATFIVEIDGDGTFIGQATSKVLLASIPPVVTSSDMWELIYEKADGKFSVARLEAEVIEDTNVISMSAVGYSPESAYDTLKTALDIFPDLTRHSIGKISVSYIIKPSVPTSSDGAADAIKSVLSGLLIGAVICLGAIALYVVLFPTFDSVEEIRRRFGFEKVLSIPEINNADPERPFRINDKSVNRRFYDAIGRMRSSIAHEARKKDVRTILVTSTAASEGKTTVAVNFALSLAQHGMRVLLIDCDLRNPSLEDTIGADARGVSSFSEVIRGRAKLSDALIRYAANLDVICEKEFNEDAAELITSEFVRKLILTAREKYDYVIVDTPPLTAASDAAVLAEYLDAFIYVIKRGHTSVHSVEESIEQLRFCSAVPIAAVLNMSSESTQGYGYGYYGGYYGSQDKKRERAD
ncbi:MAG: polysaccharide biosynthesis tyrosine autokinase [Clostridia bacterium]|nr:polysaccharide biosynthesis tyrosine autokinase [Clostridia bacterium]